MYKFQRPLIFIFIISALLNSVISYSWVIASAMIVEMITMHIAINQFVMRVLGFVIGILICSILQQYLMIDKKWRFIDLHMKFLTKRMEKIVYMDYEKLESPTILDYNERASRAMQSSTSGIEGMINLIQNIISDGVLVIFSVGIIWRWHPIIIFINMIVAIVCFRTSYQIEITNKKEEWDKQSMPLRKLSYLQRVTTDFAYGKEIRLFNMKKWLIHQNKEINHSGKCHNV